MTKISLDMLELELNGLMGITAGAIANGQPVLCNGANMAYPKSVFEEVRGYENDSVASGDDTALLKKISEIDASRIHFVKYPLTMVQVYFPNTLKEFFSQRRRWASKVPQMSSLAVFISVAAVLCHALILALFVYALMGFGWKWLMIVLGAKLFSEFLLLASVTYFLANRRLLWLLLPAQLIYPFYILVVGIASRFGSYKWKGSSVKI
jgi:cellulose synthase/poly-beta-1,6-N-acetylglucosamine synthase-like glycosyltransferase